MATKQSNDDLFLPVEVEAPQAEPRKIVDKYEREEAYRLGIWTDGQGKQHHLADMHTLYIERCLNTLWSWACREAVYQNKPKRRYSSMDAYSFLQGDHALDTIRDEFDYESECDPFYDDRPGVSAEDLWDKHPFVVLALQALRIRNVTYTAPYERDLPF